MKKITGQLLLPLFAALFAVFLFTASSNTILPSNAADTTEQKNQLSVLKDKYNQAAKKAKEVKNNLANTQSAIKTNLQRKDELDKEIVALTEQIMTAEMLIDEYEVAINEKQLKKSDLEKNREEQYETLGEILRASYMYGDESYIDLILGSKDIGDFLQRLDFISYHFKYGNTLIENIDATTAQIDEVTQSLETTLEAMTEIKEELETAKSDIEPKLIEVDNLIANLQKDESYLRNQLSQEEKDTAVLEADIKALEKKIAEAERDNNSAKPTKSLPGYTGPNDPGDGRIIWPIDRYRPLTSSYGYRKDPFTGKTAFHNGLDIAAPYGTYIYAAESGTVIRASRYDTYGECVMIDHGGGMVTLYAHCSGYNVKVGQKVTQGDVIAFVGSTGRSTGNHLHFVVRINGNYVDPNDYLP